jgi:hypothetical protein
MFPYPPDGYRVTLANLQNLLLALHSTEPTLYLDEATMAWLVLDQHVSQVHDAQEPSAC